VTVVVIGVKEVFVEVRVMAAALIVRVVVQIDLGFTEVD
jgi:hypothetical protein